MTQLVALLLSVLSTISVSLESLTQDLSLGGYLVLVNRDYTLNESYEPADLIKPNVRNDSSSILMRKDAAHALEELFAAAKSEMGYTLIASSGYRSYRTQELIFARKIKNTGSREKAMRLVAPPGASEHQLGLAMDLKCPSVQNLNASFAKTKEGQWIRENAHRFGFIIRYKEEWTEITGYAYEPWHIRYVGKEHASVIYQMDIPLEEYIAMLRTIAEDEYLKGSIP